MFTIDVETSDLRQHLLVLKKKASKGDLIRLDASDDEAWLCFDDGENVRVSAFLGKPEGSFEPFSFTFDLYGFDKIVRKIKKQSDVVTLEKESESSDLRLIDDDLGFETTFTERNGCFLQISQDPVSTTELKNARVVFDRTLDFISEEDGRVRLTGLNVQNIDQGYVEASDGSTASRHPVDISSLSDLQTPDIQTSDDRPIVSRKGVEAAHYASSKAKNASVHLGFVSGGDEEVWTVFQVGPYKVWAVDCAPGTSFPELDTVLPDTFRDVSIRVDVEELCDTLELVEAVAGSNYQCSAHLVVEKDDVYFKSEQGACHLDADIELDDEHVELSDKVSTYLFDIKKLQKAAHAFDPEGRVHIDLKFGRDPYNSLVIYEGSSSPPSNHVVTVMPMIED
jgi:hypothetical protein